MDDKTTKISDDHKFKELILKSNGLAIPVAGLFLALILFSGIEGTLNKIEIALLENSQIMVSGHKDSLTFLPQQQLAQVNNLIKQRYQDVRYGLEVSNKNLLSLNDKMWTVLTVKGHYLVTLSNSLRQEIASMRSNTNQKLLGGSLKLVQAVEDLTLEFKSGANKLADNVFKQGQNLVVLTDNLRVDTLTAFLSTQSYIEQSLSNLVWAGTTLSSQTAGTWSLTAQTFGQTLNDFWSQLSDYIQLVYTNVNVYLGRVINNWSNFVLGKDEKETQLAADLLREQLKQEILAEVNSEIETILQAQGGGTPRLIESESGQGIVILPKTDSLSQAEVKDKLQTMFSDKVMVKFDNTGQAGVITPIFKTATGRDYIFVLTPINQ